MIINFDMDGTIADLYGDPDWLAKLLAHDPSPYGEARPLVNMAHFARLIHRLQGMGIQVAIISWLSKDPSEGYGEEVTEEKLDWLERHLPSVHWDFIDILPYGTPKGDFAFNPDDILFDDEQRNRDGWPEVAYDVQDILGVLSEIAKGGK